MSEQFRNDANLNSAHRGDKMEVATFSSPREDKSTSSFSERLIWHFDFTLTNQLRVSSKEPGKKIIKTHHAR